MYKVYKECEEERVKSVATVPKRIGIGSDTKRRIDGRRKTFRRSLSQDGSTVL